MPDNKEHKDMGPGPEQEETVGVLADATDTKQTG